MLATSILSIRSLQRGACLSVMLIFLFVSLQKTNAQSNDLKTIHINCQALGKNQTAFLRIDRNSKPCLYIQIQTDVVHSYKLAIKSGDTIVITASNADSLYGTRTVYASTEPALFVTIVLLKSTQILEEITVRPSGYYKKGDTTAYMVNFFSHAEDRTLKDLLVRIPHVQIESDGSVFYKGKKISIIRIQGEELFADQIQLLTSQIPVHVLQSIEMIENTAPNRILKGLRKNGAVFLNLTIKEKYKRKAWGTLLSETGTGAGPIYRFSPIVFSIKTKTKIGWISTTQNTGINQNKAEQRQMKTPNLLELLPFTGQPPDLLIPFIDAERYLNRNRLQDYRLQITHSIKKHTKLILEVKYMNGHASQQTDLKLQRISDSLLKTQQWITSKRWNPEHLSFRVSQQWAKKADEYKFSLLLQQERDQFIESGRFDEMEISSGYGQKRRQKTCTNLAEGEWIHRMNQDRAKKMKLSIEKTNYQVGAGHGISEPVGLLNLTAGSLFLNQETLLSVTRIQTSVETIASTSVHSRPLQWELIWERIGISTSLIANIDSSTNQIIKIPGYSWAGNFETGRLQGEKSKEKKKKNGLTKISAKFGFGFYRLEEPKVRSRIAFLPFFQIQRETEKLKTGKGTWYSHLLFEEGPAELFKLNQNPAPMQGLQYNTYKNPALQKRFLFAGASFQGIPGNRLMPAIEFSCFTQFLSPVAFVLINGPFIQNNVENIGKPTSSLQIGGRVQWSNGKNSPVIVVGIKSGIMEQLLQTGSSINKFRSGYIKTEMNVNWEIEKGIALSSSTELEQRSTLSTAAMRQTGKNQNLIFRHKFRLNGQIKENLSWSCFAFLNRNLVNSISLKNSIFLETKVRLALKHAITIQIEGYNLLNIHSYAITEQEVGLFQNTLSIPVVPRQIIAGFSCSF